MGWDFMVRLDWSFIRPKLAGFSGKGQGDFDLRQEQSLLLQVSDGQRVIIQPSRGKSETNGSRLNPDANSGCNRQDSGSMHQNCDP